MCAKVRNSFVKTITAVAVVSFLFSFPCYCQGNEFRLSAAVWCKVIDGKKPVESSSDTSDSYGCDAGLGFSLYHLNRAHIVGVIGAQSVGAGFAWVLSPETAKRTIAVAIGIIMPYDTNGVYARDYSLALGTTISLGAREDKQ